MKQLEQNLNYIFKNKKLLTNALTHSSYANENKRAGASSNERLEFLGDSVLGMTVAEFIYKSRPHMPEGQMTKLRAELVCEKSLKTVADELNLSSFILLGKGEEKGGGRERPSILADAVEAIIAAMYLDGGIEPVRALISRFIAPKADSAQQDVFDYKTALQEVVQERSGQVLNYQLLSESGPDHMKTFKVEVKLNGATVGTGEGRSKKEAEQLAAKAALEGI